MDAKPAATTVLHIVLNGVSGKQNLPESPHHNLSPFFHISQFQRIIDMEPLDMTLEEVLERNQFLQKALDEAIDLGVIHTSWCSRYIVAGCGGDNYATYDAFPALVEYLEKKK